MICEFCGTTENVDLEIGICAFCLEDIEEDQDKDIEEDQDNDNT